LLRAQEIRFPPVDPHRRADAPWFEPALFSCHGDLLSRTLLVAFAEEMNYNILCFGPAADFPPGIGVKTGDDPTDHPNWVVTAAADGKPDISGLTRPLRLYIFR